MHIDIFVVNGQVAHNFVGTDIDRSVYIGTPLCVQVVVPTLMEEKLVEAMAIVDSALKGTGATSGLR
jgi:amidase